MMSESERANFLKAAVLVSRAPGKRQIKPSAAVFEGEAGMLDDDEDDEDFLAGEEGGSEEGDVVSDDDDSGSGTSASSSSDGDGEEDDDEDTPENSGTDDNGDSIPSSSKVHPILVSAGPLICSICLNLKNATRGAEVIQCDRCGLAVHEGCYAVEDLPDNVSETSSASTEPWYCEPCMIGANPSPPHCELCPNRYGAFKKANVDGCWVHLLCALYTPGISFGDVDHLSAVSWQEMDTRQFGRRECAACTDKLSARTGTTVQCEAGLCKSFYHVTCAQRLGLLMDSETDEHGTHHAAVERAGHVDFNFLLCKRHNHSDSARLKRDAYAKFMRQEQRRMSTFYHRLVALTSRQEMKRRKQLSVYAERMKQMEAFVTPHVDTKAKRTRMIHSSSRLLSAFAEKAELVGVDAKQFEAEFLAPPGEQIFVIPPAFSAHFIRYFEHRENAVFKEEAERLEYAKKERDEIMKELKAVEHELKVREKKPKVAQEQAKTAAAASTALMARFTSALQALGVQKKHLPLHTPQQMAKLNNPLRALKSSEQLSVEVKNDLTPKKEGRTITNMAKKRKAADDLAANESGGGAAKRKKITLTASSSEKKNGRGVRAVASPKATVPKRKNAAASASSTTEQRLLSQSAAGHPSSSAGSHHFDVASAFAVSRGRQISGESATTNTTAFINGNGSVSAFSILKNHPVSASMNITDETTVKDILSLLSSAKQQQRQQSPDKLSGSATPPPGAAMSPKKRPNILARGLKPPALYGIGEIVAAALNGDGDETDLLKIEEPICVDIPTLSDSAENGRPSKSPKSKKSPKIVNGHGPKSPSLRKSGPLSPKAGSKPKLMPNSHLNGSTSPKSSPISDVTKQAITNAVAKLNASQTRLLEKHRLSGDSSSTVAASYRNASLLSLLSSNGSVDKGKSRSAAAFAGQKAATSSSSSTSNEGPKSATTAAERKPPLPVVSHECHTCGKDADQHLLVHCVTCKFHYHVGCLDPPLAKPPANHRNFAFECADCAFPSSSSSGSDGEEEANGVMADRQLSNGKKKNKTKKKKDGVADNCGAAMSDEPLATRRQRRSTAASAVVALSHIAASEQLSGDDPPSSKRSSGGGGKRGGASGKKQTKGGDVCYAESEEVKVDRCRDADATTTVLSSPAEDTLNGLSDAVSSAETKQSSKTTVST